MLLDPIHASIANTKNSLNLITKNLNVFDFTKICTGKKDPLPRVPKDSCSHVFDPVQMHENNFAVS
jgi:hypothetical protein